jgi:hypothetical protein
VSFRDPHSVWDPGVQRDIADRADAKHAGPRAKSAAFAAADYIMANGPCGVFLSRMAGALRRFGGLSAKQLEATNDALARAGRGPIRLASRAAKAERRASERAAACAALASMPRPLKPPGCA